MGKKINKTKDKSVRVSPELYRLLLARKKAHGIPLKRQLEEALK